MTDKIKVFGNANTDEFYIVSQTRNFELNEYFILKDEDKSIPVEVVQTTSSQLCIPGMLPIDVPKEYIEYLELNPSNRTYFAKVKVLIHLSKPCVSDNVQIAKFEEVESILINCNDVDNSMILGGIQGTSSMYEDLPAYLKNIAPIFLNGKIRKQTDVPFIIDQSTHRENPHMGYFGGTGSGKSYALRVTCEELMKNQIPGILIDPHYEMDFNERNSEYGIDYSKRNRVFYIGKDIGIRFTELTSSELIRLCEFVDPLTQPQQATLETLYERGMSQMELTNRIEKIKEIISINEKYSKKDITEYMDNLQAENSDIAILYHNKKSSISNATSLEALSWKINKLISSTIFSEHGINKIEETLLSGKLAIIRGDMNKLKMLSSYLVTKMYDRRRLYQDSITKENLRSVEFFPMFYIIFDEAHGFAPAGTDQKMMPTKKVLKNIAQEARKYGVFMILGTQRVGLLDSTIVSQMNTKFIFRTTNAEDLATIEKECNLKKSEVKLLPDLPSGYCIATSPTLSKNFHIKFRSAFTKSPHTINCFEELRDYNKNNNNEKEIEERVLQVALDFVDTFKTVKKREYPALIAELSKVSKDEVDTNYVLSILSQLHSIGCIEAEKAPMNMGYIYISKK